MPKNKRHKKKRFKLRRAKIQSFFEQMIKISPLVASILKKDLEARDDDNILCILVWKAQGAKEKSSFKQFKYNLILNKFATPETITRSRRKIQEKNSSLRGELYKQRHQAEEDMRSQLKLF